MTPRLITFIMTSTLLSSANLLHANTVQALPTAENILSSRQEYGALQIDLSVDGKPLYIAGEKFEKGLGTHAFSMLPLSVPQMDKGQCVISLNGKCGVDDEVKQEGSVEFRILSGSGVLWSSGPMKKGMKAKSFSIPIEAAKLRHVYLVVDSLGSIDSDHADWVDLTWKTGPAPAVKKPVQSIDVGRFGMTPNVKKDQSDALRTALSAARAQGAKVLNIPKGTYHFYADNALKMAFYASNHDQPNVHPVSIPLIDLKNITIEGNGSTFLFHGMGIHALVMDSENVKINNLAIDSARPHMSEGHIVGFEGNKTDMVIDSKLYPYKIENNRFKFIGEGWTEGSSGGMGFKKGSRHIPANTGDIGWNGHVEDLGNGKVRLDWNLKEKGFDIGDAITFRSWGRPHPGVVVYRANNTSFNQVFLHHAYGMALLAQRSENISFVGGGVNIPKGSPRSHTPCVDATHFSNTRGKIVVKNALFEGMMDDAINVHSTCLGIQSIDGKNLRCRYMHGQAIGFEVFTPGETIQFITGPTLEPKDKGKIASITKLSPTEVIITMENDLPASVQVGDAIENADWYPEVLFKKNVVRNNRARGSLFTTPKKVVVEDNLFDHSSGSAILLAGDAQGWYESGACDEVIIRNNTFINNLTSRYQFTNAIISIFPEVKQLDKQDQYYHRNVLIENNVFKTHHVPLLFAISTKGLFFKNNTIEYNNDFPAWNNKPFEFKRCADIQIIGNKITPQTQWTIKDCTLSLTPEDQVKIEDNK